MINLGAYLDVLDNSGALKVQCIGLYKNSLKKGAKIGKIILIVVKNSRISAKINKGKLSKALIVNTKRSFNNNKGIVIKFNRNSVLLLDNKFYPISTRFRGPLISTVFSLEILKRLLSLGSFIL